MGLLGEGLRATNGNAESAAIADGTAWAANYRGVADLSVPKLNSTIMLVEATDDRLRCDATYVLDSTMDRRFAKRPMSSQLVVVGSILRQDPA